jgi:hypothetical protein
VRVEGTITELLADPLPAAAAKEPRAQNFTIPVGDTGLRIEYNVDPSQHVVRLYDLRNERGTSVSATDDADGLS